MQLWPIMKDVMMVMARHARAAFWGKTCIRYAANGWPRSDSMTAPMSTTV